MLILILYAIIASFYVRMDRAARRDAAFAVERVARVDVVVKRLHKWTVAVAAIAIVLAVSRESAVSEYNESISVTVECRDDFAPEHSAERIECARTMRERRVDASSRADALEVWLWVAVVI
jgi:hypothetical protein